MWRGKMEIRTDVARRFGELLSSMAAKVPLDPFTNPDLYPPKDASRREVTAYFFVMVAMDHRLSRPGRPYEAVVDGKLFHGADLLYKLGSKKLAEDPEFFSAERLAKISADNVKRWLSVGNARPPDPEIRAALLRDLGEKLLKLYGGDPYEIVLESRGRLRGEASGFLTSLKAFAAYQDPVEKKPFLLAKFLERRGVLEILDQHNKEVPVDNHLVRIAVRVGLVDASREMIERMAAGIELSEEEDVLVRLAVRMAYKEAAAAGGIDPFIMDDLLWNFGRECCGRERQTCRSSCSAGCMRIAGCNGGCVLSPVCRAFRDPLYMVPEHKFYGFWY